MTCDICEQCQYQEHRVTLRRCARCLVLGCCHRRKDSKCRPQTEECQYYEVQKVKRAWMEELRADGYCVTPTGRIDGHGKYVQRIEGEICCSFCRRSRPLTQPRAGERRACERQ